MWPLGNAPFFSNFASIINTILLLTFLCQKMPLWKRYSSFYPEALEWIREGSRAQKFSWMKIPERKIFTWWWYLFKSTREKSKLCLCLNSHSRKIYAHVNIICLIIILSDRDVCIQGKKIIGNRWENLNIFWDS